jgi:hypothetical protein
MAGRPGTVRSRGCGAPPGGGHSSRDRLRMRRGHSCQAFYRPGPPHRVSGRPDGLRDCGHPAPRESARPYRVSGPPQDLRGRVHPAPQESAWPYRVSGPLQGLRGRVHPAPRESAWPHRVSGPLQDLRGQVACAVAVHFHGDAEPAPALGGPP